MSKSRIWLINDQRKDSICWQVNNNFLNVKHYRAFKFIKVVINIHFENSFTFLFIFKHSHKSRDKVISFHTLSFIGNIYYLLSLFRLNSLDQMKVLIIWFYCVPKNIIFKDSRVIHCECSSVCRVKSLDDWIVGWSELIKRGRLTYRIKCNLFRRLLLCVHHLSDCFHLMGIRV